MHLQSFVDAKSLVLELSFYQASQIFNLILVMTRKKREDVPRRCRVLGIPNLPNLSAEAMPTSE